MSTEIPLVYVVDDDPSVRRSLGRLLRSMGLRSREFRSGPELLADAHRSEADCLLVDIHMPRMSGYDLASELDKANLSQPVIYITAQSEELQRWQPRPSSAVALLLKPFSERDLISALEQALGSDLATPKPVV